MTSPIGVPSVRENPSPVATTCPKPKAAQEYHDEVLQLLDAIEPPASLTPRSRLALGLLGLIKVADFNGVEGLHSAGVKSLYNEAVTTLADGDDYLASRCLNAIAELCKEVECSELLGAIGGHQTVLRLMTGGEIPCKSSRQGNAEHSLAGQQDNTTPLQEVASNDGLLIGAACDGSGNFDENEEIEDKVQAAAALVAARVVSSGCAFPMRSSSSGPEVSELGRYPLRYDFAVNSGDLPLDEKVEGKSLDIESCTSSKEGTRGISDGISILLRTVKERQQSQFDVGLVMWPAAVILSRMLCKHPEQIRGKSVLEIGSGLGLTGLVASHMASDVTLSDFNPLVLRNLEANVALNAGQTDVVAGTYEAGIGGSSAKKACERGGMAIATPGRVRVRRLDWDKLEVPEGCPSSSSLDPAEVMGPSASDGERSDSGIAAGAVEAVDGFERAEQERRFEVIIASDHICQASDAEGSVRVLQTLLARRGHAYFVVAHPRTRWGVDALVPLLEKSPGLEFTCEEVSDPDLVAGLEEADFLAWLYVHVWWSGEESALQPEGLLITG